MKYLAFFVLILLSACDPRHEEVPGSVHGFVPVYASLQNPTAISLQPARATEHPGKIYAYGNYLFQVEEGRGIHIINNSNPQQAAKLAFLEILTCTELAIKANYLYTNQFNDLVVIDISNIHAPQEVSRLENAFPQISQTHPPFTNVYFECVDPSKGMVIGWEEKMIKNPKCRR